MIIIEETYNDQMVNVNTDFNIRNNPSLKVIIELIEGVEDLDTFGCYKYSFSVRFGKSFDVNDIKKQIEIKIKNFVDEN